MISAVYGIERQKARTAAEDELPAENEIKGIVNSSISIRAMALLILVRRREMCLCIYERCVNVVCITSARGRSCY